MSVLLVALVDRMSNGSCCFSALSDAWLYSVAGVGVGTTCAAVWLDESQDLILLKECARSNERQYLNCNIRKTVCPQIQDELMKVQNESTSSVGKAFLTEISMCCIKCN